MAENENPTGENENPPEEENEETAEGGDDEEEKDDKNTTVPKSELEKAIKRRDAAIAARRKTEQELAKLKAKDEEKADPIKEANAKIVRTSAHGILRGLGVEDKADRAAVLDVLKLDDIEVDADGADEDAIEERIGDLRRILGVGAPPAKRVPKTVRTADKGGKETTTDPDANRYKRILGRA